MHNLQQPGMGMSPMLQPQQQQQPSPQQHLQQQQQLQQQQLMQGVIGPQQVPTMVHPQQQQPPQQPEKNDNISKVKTLVAPLRESLLVIEDIRNVFGSKCVFFVSFRRILSRYLRSCCKTTILLITEAWKGSTATVRHHASTSTWKSFTLYAIRLSCIWLALNASCLNWIVL